MDYHEKVYDIVNETESGEKSDELFITLANGVVLKPRPVPPLTLAKIERRFKYPPVPVVRDEERGREFPNPNDPSYIEDCKRVDEEKSMAQLDVIIGLGTELVSTPEDVYGPDEDDWIQDTEFFVGEEMPRQGRARYLAWLKYYAMAEADDIPTVAKLALKRTGVADEDVEDAVAGFRGQKTRGSDPSDRTEE